MLQVDFPPVSTRAGGFYLVNCVNAEVSSNVFSNLDGGHDAGCGWTTDTDLRFIGNQVIDCIAWNTAGGLRLIGTTNVFLDTTIRGNYFEDNLADFSGAVHIDGVGHDKVVIDNNVFARSGADFKQGGAIHLNTGNPVSDIRIVNNSFRDSKNPGFDSRKAIYVLGAAPLYAINKYLSRKLEAGPSSV